MSADTEKTTTEMKPVPAEGSTTPQPELIPVTDIYAEPERRSAPPSSADAPREPTDFKALFSEAQDIIDKVHQSLSDKDEDRLRQIILALFACTPAADPAPADKRFPEADLMVNLGPTVAARVVIGSRDGKGWTLNELARLIAFLELQRSFLEDAPLKVSVTFGTPK